MKQSLIIPHKSLSLVIFYNNGNDYSNRYLLVFYIWKLLNPGLGQVRRVISIVRYNYCYRPHVGLKENIYLYSIYLLIYIKVILILNNLDIKLPLPLIHRNLFFFFLYNFFNIMFILKTAYYYLNNNNLLY